MRVLGLTGSIGMGKSTTASFFAEAGVPVDYFDAVVHRLYEGDAVAPVEAAFPGVAVDGKIDRAKLAAQLIGKPDAIKRLEAIVHPLVTGRYAALHTGAGGKRRARDPSDIPLLFETGGEKNVDAVVVVSSPPEVQRARVLGRPGMTAEKLDAILAKQMPDPEKRRRADFIVNLPPRIRGSAHASACDPGRHRYNAEAAVVIRRRQ